MFNNKARLNIINSKSDKRIINVDCAITEQEWLHGLKGKTELKENEGLLFIFPESTPRNMTMNGCPIDLDMIFIQDNVIQEIIPFVKADTEGPYLCSKPVHQILEVAAGFCEKFEIAIGDRVS